MPLCADFKYLTAISGDEVNVHDDDYLVAVIGCLSYLKHRGYLPADFDSDSALIARVSCITYRALD